ncbi:MAG: glycosyltransferase [Nitrospinae bacterium]|nr:glycosyltransferase [Nitrospinota bacterium]
MTSPVPKISAVVIAYNDEPNMKGCLESVLWADELIVVDSYSTDATEKISRQYTDQVYQHEFNGFGKLRNEAIAHARYDWIFSLDTDERATPEIREEIVGIAEVKDVFSSKKLGDIAGCMVIEGTVSRSKRIRVLRDNVVIYEGELESLRHFKDEVEEVKSGTECGIGVKNYNDVKVGDQIEVFDTREVAREL